MSVSWSWISCNKPLTTYLDRDHQSKDRHSWTIGISKVSASIILPLCLMSCTFRVWVFAHPGLSPPLVSSLQFSACGQCHSALLSPDIPCSLQRELSHLPHCIQPQGLQSKLRTGALPPALSSIQPISTTAKAQLVPGTGGITHRGSANSKLSFLQFLPS